MGIGVARLDGHTAKDSCWGGGGDGSGPLRHAVTGPSTVGRPLPPAPDDGTTPLPGYVTPKLTRWRAKTDGPLLVLAIASPPLPLLERDDLPRDDRFLIDGVNLLVLVAFAVDYLVELRLTRPRPAFLRGELGSLLINGTTLSARRAIAQQDRSRSLVCLGRSERQPTVPDRCVSW